MSYKFLNIHIFTNLSELIFGIKETRSDIKLVCTLNNQHEVGPGLSLDTFVK